MKMLPQALKTARPVRRAILTTAILPALFASSAFGLTIWNGPVALSTAAAPDNISVQGTSTVTLSNGGPLSITESSITFAPASGSAETLTVDGPGLTLRSLYTILATSSAKTVTINGSADFAPGALYTGPTVGAATLTGINLVKSGGTGVLIFDDPINALAGTTLKNLDGTVAVFGGGGTANPLSTLTSSIELGSSVAQTTQLPVLRFVGNGVDNTTFANNFKAFYNSTIEHRSTTSDTISSVTGSNGIATGKTLTVNVAEGGLNIAGGIANTSSTSVRGGNLRKTGVDTTLTLSGITFIANLNVAEGRVEAPGRLRATSITFGANSTLVLRNPSTLALNELPTTIDITPGGTLEGLPGNFVNGATQSTLKLSGGTLNLGLGGAAASAGLSAHLYNGDDTGANAAFNTFANFSAYFAGRGPGVVTTTGANGVPELSFAPGGGDTAMFATIAPSFTSTNNIVSRFNGQIVVNSAGTYTFATTSDDGSMLYIDGQTVVANNFYQGANRRTGTLNLAPGLHDIEIGFYEGGGANSLVVDYSGPDTGDVQTTVPNSILLSADVSTFLNPVVVTETSTIKLNTPAATVASTALGAGKTLNVNGYKLDMGPLTLGVAAGVPTPSAGTYTFNPSTQFGQAIARSIVDGGLDVDLVNSGPGMLVLESGASPQLQNAGSSVTALTGELGVVLGGAGGSPTGNATVNVKSLTLSSKGGNQSYTPTALTFTNDGSIAAGKIGTGVAGTAATPIRVTLTPALTVGAGKSLTTSTRDNYTLVLPAISGAGTLNLGGTVESGGVVNVGLINVLDGSTVTNLGNITTTSGITLNGATVPSRLNLNGGTVSGGPVTVNTGTTLSLGADNVLGNFVTSVSGVIVNGGKVTAVAGTHSTLPALTLNEGTLDATGPGNAPGGGPTINYILNGNVTTVAAANQSAITAPAILLRGAGAPGPVTFTVPRGTAETDLLVSSVIHDGGAGLIKNGDGILKLSGVSTFTGPTVINAGTVAANDSASLGASAVRLNSGGILSLLSPPSVAGFANVSLNGVATLDPTNSIVTLTSNLGGQGGSVFTQTKYGVGDGFSASFVYTASGARGADGITFTVQNSAPTALGGLGGALGYVGIPNSAALELNIYNGHVLGTNFVTDGTTGNYISSAPVNLGSGHPIKVDVIYDSAALTLTEFLLDQVTGDTYTNTFTVPALSGIIGGNLAYIGFTGATGGEVATQTVGNFRYNEDAQQGLTLGNNITVGAGTTGGLDVPPAGPGAGGGAALAGVLTLNAGSILDVTGGAVATDTPYTLDVTGSTTLAGDSTINVTNNGTGLGTLHLDDVSGVGRTLTKIGAGRLVLSGVLNLAVLNANGGTTDLDSSLTLSALNIGAGSVVVIGGSAPPPLAFGAEASGAAAQAVPEPGSLHLLLAGALGWFTRRQRPQRR